MNWKKIFTPLKNIDVDSVRAIIEKETGDRYQLLDVRQPKEYADGHLPGAILIPLKELPNRLNELNSEKPTIVYCASGGRSRAAAHFLSGKNFASVLNMQGGIKAWNGRKAMGPEEIGLIFFEEEGDFKDGLTLAYAMENGLQQFYLRLLEISADAAQKKLIQRLAGFEDLHKKNLLDAYREQYGEEMVLPDNLPLIMEGGRRVDDYLKRASVLLNSSKDLLHLAMGLEVQAYDLYSRMAQKSNRPETKKLFAKIADEEKQHLAYMTEELERML